MVSLLDRTSWWAVGFTFIFTLLLATQVGQDVPPFPASSEAHALRIEMDQTRTEVMALELTFGSLRDLNETQQVSLMGTVSCVLVEQLLSYLAAEERELYPAIDQMMGKTAIPFTRPLRKELELMRKEIEELERLADAPFPNASLFIRKGERLLGQVEAHFAVDESVLFPLVDREPTAPSIAARQSAARARTPRRTGGGLLTREK